MPKLNTLQRRFHHHFIQCPTRRQRITSWLCLQKFHTAGHRVPCIYHAPGGHLRGSSDTTSLVHDLDTAVSITYALRPYFASYSPALESDSQFTAARARQVQAEGGSE